MDGWVNGGRAGLPLPPICRHPCNLTLPGFIQEGILYSLTAFFPILERPPSRTYFDTRFLFLALVWATVLLGIYQR